MASNYKWKKTRVLNLFGVRALTTAGAGDASGGLGVAVVGGEIQGKFLKPGTKSLSLTQKVEIKNGTQNTYNYTFTITTENYNWTTNGLGQIVPANPALPYGSRILVDGQLNSARQQLFLWTSPTWSGIAPNGTQCVNIRESLLNNAKWWSSIFGGWTGGNTDDGWGMRMEGTPSAFIEAYAPSDFSFCNTGEVDEQGNPIPFFEATPEGESGGVSWLYVYITAPSATNAKVSIGSGTDDPPTNRREGGGGGGGGEDENEEDNPPPGLEPSQIGGFPVLPGIPTTVPSTPTTIMVAVQPDPIVFENTTIGQYRTKSFTILNRGTAPFNLTDIRSAIPTTPFGFVCNYSTPIPPGGSRTATAYFVPTEARAYDEFCILFNEVGPIYEFQLQGTGVTEGGDPGEEEAVRSISLRGDTAANGDINFLEQTIGSTTVRQLFAVNTGTVPVVFNSYSLGGSGAFDTTGVSAGFNLQPGQEKAIPIAFIPVAAEEYIGTFSLVTNATTSPQTGIFNPATGTITANFDGKGVPEEVITRIMAFNVQNGGTLPDALAGGSATSEITATISSTGTGSILITSFQVEAPFTLDLANFGSVTPGTLGIVNLNTPLVLAPEQVSLPFIIKFTPPTATNYVDDVALFSNKTIGPSSFEVRGLGTFTEPEGPSGPVEPPTPDEEPGPEFDPGTTPSTGLDGIGSTCIPKECEVTYVYEYSANGEVVT